jgi:soluble lytic murein transglycosylase-like protein
MRRLTAIIIMAAATAAYPQARFSASDVPGAGIRRPGRVVIQNDGRAITAYRFFGSIREAIFSLRTSRTLAYRPFGASLFDSSARLSAPVPAGLAGIVADASRTHGVDPRLVAAVAGRESAWNAASVSSSGACGIMQLMPDTARFLGVANVFDVHENIFAGARYLRTLLDVFHGDLDLTLAAYNAGPGAVNKYGGVPPYRETQAYVRSVRAAYERALLAQ